MCVYGLPMYLVKPLSRDKGKRQIHNVSALFALQIPWCERGRYIVYLPFSLVPREGLYQIHGQSLNTHRGKHRSGDARTLEMFNPRLKLSISIDMFNLD